MQTLEVVLYAQKMRLLECHSLLVIEREICVLFHQLDLKNIIKAKIEEGDCAFSLDSDWNLYRSDKLTHFGSGNDSFTSLSIYNKILGIIRYNIVWTYRCSRFIFWSLTILVTTNWLAMYLCNLSSSIMYITI